MRKSNPNSTWTNKVEQGLEDSRVGKSVPYEKLPFPGKTRRVGKIPRAVLRFSGLCLAAVPGIIVVLAMALVCYILSYGITNGATP